MKSDDPSRGIDRRALVSSLILLPALSAALLSSPVQAQTTSGASLASWNDVPAKQAILDFVRATTDQGSPKFVPTEDRVATFDQDGTLWVEHPIYTQIVYCLDRVSTLATQKPELKRIEPFKTVLSGDREAAGLNKGEAHNGLARAVFFNRLGELRDRIPESQRSQPCCRANYRNSRSTG